MINAPPLTAEDPRESKMDRRWGWEELATKGMEAHRVPGDQLSMMKEPHLQAVASLLKSCMDEADAAPGE